MLPRHFRLRLVVAALVLPLAIAACGSPSGPSRFDRVALERAKAAWAAQGARNYVLVVGTRCFCGHLQIRMTVVDGVATERVFMHDGSPVPPLQFTNIATVDSMLAHLDRAIREGAYEIDATYDARGIP